MNTTFRSESRWGATRFFFALLLLAVTSISCTATKRYAIVRGLPPTMGGANASRDTVCDALYSLRVRSTQERTLVQQLRRQLCQDGVFETKCSDGKCTCKFDDTTTRFGCGDFFKKCETFYPKGQWVCGKPKAETPVPGEPVGLIECTCS